MKYSASNGVNSGGGSSPPGGKYAFSKARSVYLGKTSSSGGEGFPDCALEDGPPRAADDDATARSSVES